MTCEKCTGGVILHLKRCCTCPRGRELARNYAMGPAQGLIQGAILKGELEKEFPRPESDPWYDPEQSPGPTRIGSTIRSQIEKLRRQSTPRVSGPPPQSEAKGETPPTPGSPSALPG